MVRNRVFRRTAAVNPHTVMLLTCEHGGNRIPREYRAVFRARARLLASHRGYDRGALTLARILARTLHAPLVAATVSRLLVDLNRSPRHPALFSSVTRSLAEAQKARIVAQHYEPYRTAVEGHVAQAAAAGQTLVHLSAHSFTPVLDGNVRAADIGLLYDPSRARERALCDRWHRALATRLAPLRIRRNYPYRGTADGLTTYLRRRYPATCYLGIEVEVNQRYASNPARWRAICHAIAGSLQDALRGG